MRYPRPPPLERFVGPATVELGSNTIASTTRSWQIAETSPSPTSYLPPRDAIFAEGMLRETSGSSWCEWKDQATYHQLATVARIAPESGVQLPSPQPRIRADPWRGCDDGRPG